MNARSMDMANAEGSEMKVYSDVEGSESPLQTFVLVPAALVRFLQGRPNFDLDKQTHGNLREGQRRQLELPGTRGTCVYKWRPNHRLSLARA